MTMKIKNFDSRRSFIKKMAKGVALSTVAFSSASAVSPESSVKNDDNESVSQKNIRIGIIGAENSHTVGYGRLFNIDKKFPGVEVKYLWGETDEFARSAMEKGGIPNIVKDPKEMLGKIDALIVDHRHAKYHLEPAIPFIKAGIPTFIDKPFCYRVSEGREFLSLARSVGTPVSSWSTSAHNDIFFDLKRQVNTLGQINHIVSFGPVDIESVYGGVFFYGVHFVDQLLFLFGDDIKKVRVTRNGKNAGADLAFGNGMLATMIFLNLTSASVIYAETKNGVIELKSNVSETDPPRCYVDMVEMFRTGKEPRSHQSILYGVAVLEALEKSVSSENWEDVKV
jgi:predicted dehydrogenase